jgi:hypothetical protein
MNVELEWEKEEDIQCVCLCVCVCVCVWGGGGELGESGQFQDRQQEKYQEIIKNVYIYICRTQWLCGLRRRFEASRLLGCGFESCR